MKRNIYYFIFLLFFVLVSFSGCASYKAITFKSYTVNDYADAIDGISDDPEVQVFGKLIIPKADGKLPAMIIVHGSGGIDEKDNFWIKAFNKGFRNVSSHLSQR